MAFVERAEFGRIVVIRHALIDFTLTTKYETTFSFTQSDRGFDECIEDHLQVESRTTDDLEHVRGRRLLLERFAQFVEQPRILDGDDGLGGEILRQLYLLVGKCTGFLPVDYNHATKIPVLNHWYCEHGSKAAELHGCDEPRLPFDVTWFYSDIWNVNNPFGAPDAVKGASRFGTKQGITPPYLGQRRRHVIHCGRAKRVAFAKIKGGKFCRAKLRCIHQHCLKYRLQLAGRT